VDILCLQDLKDFSSTPMCCFVFAGSGPEVPGSMFAGFQVFSFRISMFLAFVFPGF
jgi:hypothetical protein